MKECTWNFFNSYCHFTSLGFPDSSGGTDRPAMQETWVQPLGLGRSTGEGKGYPLQYSGLENSMDCIVYGVAKSQTQLSDFHLTFYK